MVHINIIISTIYTWFKMPNLKHYIRSLWFKYLLVKCLTLVFRNKRILGILKSEPKTYKRKNCFGSKTELQSFRRLKKDCMFSNWMRLFDVKSPSKLSLNHFVLTNFKTQSLGIKIYFSSYQISVHRFWM